MFTSSKRAFLPTRSVTLFALIINKNHAFLFLLHLKVPIELYRNNLFLQPLITNRMVICDKSVPYFFYIIITL